MKRGSLFSVCFLTLFIWNCPKRQTAIRIVYVPPPTPSAGSTSQESTDAKVIEEPQPPEPEESAPAEQPPAQTPPPRRHPRLPRMEPNAPSETAPDSESAPPAEVPALEPRENPAQQAAQRQQIAGLQNNVRTRIARVERPDLSHEERRMLEDARTFLSQSERALGGSDFQRAHTLVRKASMLVAVLEQQ